MDKTTVIRPKLKHNSVFLQTEDGVFFQSDRVVFRLKGKSIGRWISALGPYMNGEHTLDELCNGFAPAQREMLTQLVNTLLQRGVLKDAVFEIPEPLPASLRRQFAAQIAYIDHFTDRPQEKFKAFRESRVLLAGSGESLTALALSLMRNGLRDLFLAPADSSEEYGRVLASEADRVRQGGNETSFSFPQNGPEDLEDYDVIVYCSDTSSLKELASLNEQCVRAGRPFLSATIFAGQTMLGPFTRSQGDPCWLCAQLRLSAHREAGKNAAFWRELALGDDLSSNSEGLFNPIARRIGHGLGFELFKILTGALPSETENGVILQDLEILEASSSKLTQHPLCPVCTRNDPTMTLQHLQEIIEGKHDHELTRNEIRTRHDRLFDSRIGAFREFNDEHIQQIPLKGARIAVSRPGASLAEENNITSYSIDDVMSAYRPAFIEAVNTYARSMPDPRGFLVASPREMAERGHTVILPQQLATWSGGISLRASTPAGWLPAFSSLRRSPVYVPAAAVYPDTSLNRLGLFERTPAGGTVATTFRDALAAGLLSALGYAHLQELMRGRAAVAQLDLELLSSAEADLAYLIKSARRFESPFACLEVIHASPLSVMIARTTDASSKPLMTFGFGLSIPEAAKMALLDFVGGLQTLQSEGELPAAIGHFCAGLSLDSDLACASPEASRLTAPACSLEQVEDYLRKMGQDALFVNTTPSDIWHAEALVSGRVLLTSGESEPKLQKS